jgi:hypothetical protein
MFTSHKGHDGRDAQEHHDEATDAHSYHHTMPEDHPLHDGHESSKQAAKSTGFLKHGNNQPDPHDSTKQSNDGPPDSEDNDTKPVKRSSSQYDDADE